jgi:hypothetical protein
MLLVFMGLKTQAHPMPNSVVRLFVLDNAIKGEAHIPYYELENALDTSSTSLLRPSMLRNYFLKHIQVTSKHDNWKIQIDSIAFKENISSAVGSYKELKVSFYLLPKSPKSLRNFTFSYDAVVHQVITHSVLVYLAQDWKNGINYETNTKPLGTISYNTVNGKIQPLQIHLDEGSSWNGFVSMVQLGMRHIQEGTDHLLFILTLLFPAYLMVDEKRWGAYVGFKSGSLKILKIVTAFTLGHTLTLLLGSFNFFELPIQLIESIIATSILISVIHCLRPIFYSKEMIIAISFGLIHGLAFSQTIQNLDLGSLNLAISVLGFNLGIEIMQLVMIIIVIPWIILLSSTNYFKPIKNGFAVLVGVAALGWLVQRVTNSDNIVSTSIERIVGYSSWLFVALAVTSLLLFVVQYCKSK